MGYASSALSASAPITVTRTLLPALNTVAVGCRSITRRVGIPGGKGWRSALTNTDAKLVALVQAKLRPAKSTTLKLNGRKRAAAPKAKRKAAPRKRAKAA